jgi:hypothetical protein
MLGEGSSVSRFLKYLGLSPEGNVAIIFVCFIAHAHFFIMLCINTQNTQFIIALNSFPTAVVLGYFDF